MVQSLELALKTALEKKQHEEQAKPPAPPGLTQTLADWSADDTVHVDPPLPEAAPLPQPQPQPQQETPTMHAAANDAPSADATTPAPERQYGITETIWNYIRDNPGRPRSSITHAMVEQHGFKADSVSSLIGQMITGHSIFRDPETHLLYVAGPRFVGLPSGELRKRLQEINRLRLERENPSRAAGYMKMAETRRQQRAANGVNKESPMEAVQTPEKKSMSLQDRAALARAALARKRAEAKEEQERIHQERVERGKKAAATTKKRREAEARAAAKAAPANVARYNAMHQAVPTTKPKHDLGTIVREVEEMPMPTLSTPAAGLFPPPADLRSMTAKDIVATMGIIQAKEVFALLSELLGGK